MPRIPQFQPEVALTTKGPAGPLTVERDIRSSGVLELASAQAWEGVGQAGQKLSEVGAKVDRHISGLQDMDALVQAKNFINQRAIEYSQSAKNNANPDDWLTLFRGDMDTAGQAALEGLNPVVAAHLKNHIATIMPSYEHSLVREGRQYKISSLRGNIPQSLDAAIQTVINAPDEIVAANAVAGFKGLVRTAANPESGYLKPEEAAQWESKFDLGLKTARINKAMLSDPAGTLAALKEPGAFGLDDTQRAAVLPGVTENLKRFQKDNYSSYMQNILGATADNPVQGVSEAEILGQVGKGLSVPQSQNILAFIRGQKASQGTGQENKTDPQSYKEAVTRLTDPDHPLTREEFLANVESGGWKFDAKTYGGFLTNITTRGTKLDKAADSAIKARLGFWRTQFGGDSRNEHYMTALGQLQMAKDSGELGATKEDMSKTIDGIFKPHANLYAQENFLGRSGPPSQPKPGIIGATGPETISKDGKTYRVLTIKGRKMVDPNPLP